MSARPGLFIYYWRRPLTFHWAPVSPVGWAALIAAFVLPAWFAVGILSAIAFEAKPALNPGLVLLSLPVSWAASAYLLRTQGRSAERPEDIKLGWKGQWGVLALMFLPLYGFAHFANFEPSSATRWLILAFWAALGLLATGISILVLLKSRPQSSSL